MRYTTVIDISDEPELCRNHTTVVVYYFLCVKCGWHSDDLDVYRQGVRFLASTLGVSYSACRNSIRMLVKHRLLEVLDGGGLKVRKFVEPLNLPKRTAKPQTREDVAYKERMEEMGRSDVKFKKMDDARARGEVGPIALLTYLREKAAAGDKKAKKEADDLEHRLREQGVLK